MSRYLYAAVVVLAIGMIAASAKAQSMTMPPGHGSATQPASGPSSQPVSEYGRYASLVADLGLSDEQKGKVKEKVAALLAAVKGPYEKAMALHQELSAAYKVDDFEKAKKLFAAIDEQKRKISDLTGKTDYEVMALLTPEQKVKIHALGFRKMVSMTLLMVKIKFTDEQEKSFQGVCQEYGKNMAELKDLTDSKAKAEIFEKAHKKFMDLLTPEQKEQLAKWAKAATQPSSNHGHGGMGGMPGQ